ncbi:hypothetical protein ABIB62_002920 [Mucilaginibacter sp. UYP25]|uniref:hypothetical protein n=1 Tax=unclassified Mucilaginibacter TaxID=2617802 RepID=UPI0033946933
MSQLAGKPNTPGFVLNIIEPNQWPSVAVRYSFNTIDATPNLQFNFAFDGSQYDGAETEKIELDLATFKIINDQLNWQYTTDDAPDVSINTLQYWATCSIAPGEHLIFGTEQLRALKNYTSVIISWLELLLIPGEDGFPDSPSIMATSLPIEGEYETQDIFELNVTICVARTASNEKQRFINILPDLTKTNQVTFAGNFENAFATGDSKLKLATGLSASNGNNANQLWVIRMADAADGKGIYYDVLNDNPVAFAPTPLSTSLFNGNVGIREYISKIGINWNDAGVNTTVEQIDPDKWLQMFLLGIDDVLSPANTAVIETITNTYNKIDRFSVLKDLLDARSVIVEKLSELLIQVVPEQTGDLTNARQQLKDQLHNSMFNFYKGTATIQFKTIVTVTNIIGSFELLGTVTPTGKSNDATFSNARIKNDTEGFMSFTVFANAPAEQGYLPVNVNYQLNSLLYTVNENTAVTLSLLIEPAAKPLSVNAPMVIRNYPIPAQIVNQIIDKTNPDPVKSEDAKTYNYNYEFNNHLIAQDVLETYITLNPANKNIIGLIRQPVNSLLESLAQFINSYSIIKADLDENLTLINDTTDIYTNAYSVAVSALTTFSELANHVKDALAINRNVTATTNPPIPKGYIFKLTAGPVSPVIDPRLIITVSATKNDIGKYPLPTISIDGYAMMLHQNMANETVVNASYTYLNANGEPLLISTEQGPLKVTVAGFDVLEVIKLSTATIISRNKNLLPDAQNGYFKTDERFVYSTPQNSFPPIEPSLDWSDTEINMANNDAITYRASLKEHLLSMFNQLLSNVSQMYSLSVAINYEYNLIEGDTVPMINMPVLLAQEMEFNAAGSAELAKHFEEALKNWQESTITEQTAGARFIFDVSIFTSLRLNRQLLHMQNIYLNLSDII